MSRKPYSDYDLGFIQDHDDWTAANIAEAIGHSIESVRTTRLKMRKGWIPRQSPEWSESEDDFLRANLRMSGQDAAAHLGRPVQGVRNRRMRLGLRIGGNWSPVVIGARPLLAKTCPKCGFLASGFKSHVGLGDPERDQWIIDNPNAGNAEEITASLAPLSPIAPAEANQPIVPQWDWDESDLKVSA